MTREQFDNEVMFQASIAPFKSMLREGIITAEEYTKIFTIWRVGDQRRTGCHCQTHL